MTLEHHNNCNGMRNMITRDCVYYDSDKRLYYALGEKNTTNEPWRTYLRYCPLCSKDLQQT